MKRSAPSIKPVVADAELVNTLDALLSFSTFSALAGPDRTPTDVVPHMRRIVRAIVGLSAPRKARKARKATKRAKPRRRR